MALRIAQLISRTLPANNIPYSQGYRAGNGSYGPKEKSANPFQKGSNDAQKWDEGFDEGKFGDGGAREAQTILAKPTDTTVKAADPELEELRAQFQAVQAKIAAIEVESQKFLDKLAKKQGAKGGIDEIQNEAIRLQTELNDKLKAFPANFIKFSDQVTFAKVQGARLNDAAWKTIITQAKTRGKGVMRRVSLILDRVALLFKKMTADVTIQEFAPGALTPKKMTDIVEKNKDNVDKINQYQQTQQDIAPRMQKYFLDEAQGGIGKPGKRKSQAEDQQMEFDYMQDLINSLEDSLADLDTLTSQLSADPVAATPSANETESSDVVESSFPLPKVAQKRNLID